MDYFDLTKQFNGNLSDAFKGSKTKFFIIKSLNHSASIGTKNAKYLLLKYFAPNKAMEHKGVKLG